MPEASVTHSKFVVERRFARPVQTVFAALADPVKKRRWFAEGDLHEIEQFESDFRVGGVERFHYRFVGEAPIKGMSIANEGRFEDIVPDRRVVTSSSMRLGDTCISASLVTMELLPDDDGTRLVCTFQGAFFEGADGPQLREMGWNVMLDALGRELA